MFDPETLDQTRATIRKLAELTGLCKEVIGGLDRNAIEFKPAPKEWSVKEVMCHLRDVDDIFYERCQKMLDEDEPFLRSFNPEELAEEEGYSRQIWDEVVREWQHNRDRNLKMFQELEPIRWLRGGFHQERGHINIMDIASALVNQCETHLEQISTNIKLANQSKF